MKAEINGRENDMTVQEKLEKFRKIMEKHDIDAYYVTTGDDHCSEYVDDHFKERQYLSGFTGSNGDLVITADECVLWTDSRYFIQAEEELKGTEIKLFREGEDETPSVCEYIEEKFSDRKTYITAMDGRTVPADSVWQMKKLLRASGGTVKTDRDFLGEMWDEDENEKRPPLTVNDIYELDVRYAGELRSQRMERLRRRMAQLGAYVHIISSLDDIAWLLNLRGSDIHCNPVALGFLVVFKEKRAYFFTHLDHIDDNLRLKLEVEWIRFRPYEEIYDFVHEITETDEVLKKKKSPEDLLYEGPGPKNGTRVLIDMRNINARIYESIKVKQNIYNLPNPTIMMKAVKNNVEQANEEDAHIMEGVAITKLIYWLKNVCQPENDYLLDEKENIVTEISVAEKLEELRKGIEGYHGPSFDTIAGFGKHGAIVHYTADEVSNSRIGLNDFLLLDMGGQYLKGTTDITRTVFTGSDADEEHKKYYTAVLRGHLELMNAQFRKGCSGVALDILARKPLWDAGLDYGHGTGHGVGYFLNVHEAPNAFRYKIINRPGANPVLEPGMITSDEPGIYLEGKFGIRIENLILCEKRFKNEYGEFLGFRPLTMVPYERDAIDFSLMTKDEIKMFNEYSEKVVRNVGPYLMSPEYEWLEKVCAPVQV